MQQKQGRTFEVLNAIIVFIYELEYYATKCANKALQATPTALANFGIITRS